MNDLNSEQASAEAIHKAKNAQAAIEIARQVQLEDILNSPRLANTIENAVIRAFEVGKGEGRYIDVSRVPLICQSIVNIDKKLEELVTQQEFWPVKTLVYGITGLMLSGMVGALLTLVLKQ